MNFKMILVGVAFLLAVMGSSVGTAIYVAKVIVPEQVAMSVGGDAVVEVPVEVAPAIYVELEPFIVNFTQDEALRYLQLKVQIMSRDAKVIEAVNTHIPEVRNELILLLSGHSYHELVTREGKETIRTQIRQEVNRILGSEDAVESVFLTGFVMQ
ncbi:MAG: flagellar basal body-associated protein FliL [Pseudomonadota bacterium]